MRATGRWTWVVLAGILVAASTSAASAGGFGGIGGIKVGGLGGLKIGGLGGLKVGGFSGIRAGGFHGGSFHVGGLKAPSMHVGSLHGSGFHSGGFHGTASLSNVRAAHGSAFAGRHFGATNPSVGRLNPTAATALVSTSTNRFPVGSTFAARHGLTASARLMTANVKPASPSTPGMGGSGGSGGMNSNSTYPYNLNLGVGGLIPRRIFLGYPSWFTYPWWYSYGYGCGGGCFSYCGYYGLATTAAFLPTSTAAAVPATTGTAGTIDYAALGETEFRAGNYVAAESHWRHALVDDTSNTAIVMLLSQALFANGKYDEAAGAIQHALRLLPTDKWGVVVGHYTELYRSNQDYTDQLRALEAASEKPETDSPGVRFLMGYHYGYLGYPKHAVRELDKAIAQVPQDETAQKLRTIMAARVPADAPAAKPTSQP